MSPKASPKATARALQDAVLQDTAFHTHLAPQQLEAMPKDKAKAVSRPANEVDLSESDSERPPWAEEAMDVEPPPRPFPTEPIHGSGSVGRTVGFSGLP